MSQAQELLERIASHRGTLLRTECERAPGERMSRPRALRLTFDIGVVELRAGASGLTATAVGLPEASGGFQSSDEADPWWRVLGYPLTRVEEDSGVLALQMRHGADAPRWIELRADGPSLAIRQR